MLKAKTIKKLRLIQQQISGHPLQFFMESFFSETNETITKCKEEMHCGTAACIAGWALANRYMKENNAQFDEAVKQQPVFGACSDGGLRNIEFIAGKNELGLTDIQAERLFIVRYWPEPYYLKYDDADGPGHIPLSYARRVKNAKLAVARIEHFIKTGGEE